jgi:hypothetical protein
MKPIIRGTRSPCLIFAGIREGAIDRRRDCGTPHPANSSRPSRLRVRHKPGLKGTAREDARAARIAYAGHFVRLRVFPGAATVPDVGIVHGRIRGFCVIRGSEI